MQKRDILVFVLLLLFTCGIYGIYWYIVFTDEVAKELPNDSRASSGLLAILFTIITCGIYALYWHYVMGAKLAEIGKKEGVSIDNNGAIYLILSLFGLGIVSFILMQSDANKLA